MEMYLLGQGMITFLNMPSVIAGQIGSSLLMGKNQTSGEGEQDRQLKLISARKCSL